MQTSESHAESDQLVRGIAETKTRLMSEFRERVQPDVIQRLVDETFNALQDAAVREFVPLFVYRSAREQLADMAGSSAV